MPDDYLNLAETRAAMTALTQAWSTATRGLLTVLEEANELVADGDVTWREVQRIADLASDALTTSLAEAMQVPGVAAS